MKVLIAIHSCTRDQRNGFNGAVRDTWLRDFNPVPKLGCSRSTSFDVVDYAFFIGQGQYLLSPDEIRVDCPDDYLSLPLKTKAVLQWSVENNYDFTFKVDTDTFVFLPRLLATNFYDYDYVGAFNGPVGVPNAVEGGYAWASGGAGYWLSKEAAKLVVASEPNHWAEDLWTSQCVSANSQMKIQNDERYGRNPGLLGEDSVSVHYCSEGKKRKFNPQWLHDIHEGREVWG